MCARNQRRYWARLGAVEKCSWFCGCYLKQRCVSKINIWVIIVACYITFVTAVGISSTCTIRLDWRRMKTVWQHLHSRILCANEWTNSNRPVEDRDFLMAGIASTLCMDRVKSAPLFISRNSRWRSGLMRLNWVWFRSSSTVANDILLNTVHSTCISQPRQPSRRLSLFYTMKT